MNQKERANTLIRENISNDEFAETNSMKTQVKKAQYKYGLVEKIPFKLEKFDLTTPNTNKGKHMIKAKTLYFAICGSDYIHSTSEPFNERFVGHEWVGTNEKGEIITTEVFWGCGKCEWCKKGMDRCCHFKKVFSMGDAGGASLLNVSLPARNVTRINRSLTSKFEIWLLTTLEPITVSYSIVDELKNLTSGFEMYKNVLILGGGFTGVAMGYLLRLLKINVKFGEKTAARKANLKKLGFKVASDLESEFDVVIDAAGERPVSGNSAFEEAVKRVRRCGIIVGSGKYVHPPQVEIKVLQNYGLTVIWPRGGKEATLTNLAMRPPKELFKLLNFLKANEKIVFKIIDFSQLPAFYTHDNQVPSALRTVVKVESGTASFN